MNGERTAHVNTNENPSDLLTKPLSGEKRATLFCMIQNIYMCQLLKLRMMVDEWIS